MTKYLLLVDRERDILELQEAALKYFYGGEIVSTFSREEALEALARLGRPELIISSLEILQLGLHDHLRDQGVFLPLIGTGDTHIPELHLLTSVLPRPVPPEELSQLVRSFTQSPPESPTHVPIKLKVACEVASTRFDIYLKLSGTNFVKITNRESEFTEAEAEKLKSKGITEVHIKASESRNFLRLWEEHLLKKVARPSEGIPVDQMLAIDSLEQVERISRAFGWSKDAVKASQKVIKDSIAVLSSNERVSDLLKRKFAERNSPYTHHVGLLCYLTSVMCSELGMPDAREKLIMASLMHDLSVDEGNYQTIHEWDKLGRNVSDRSPEAVRYRLHPVHASQTAQTIDVLPPDVDQIILQHHEAPDGSGFPRGLGHVRIHYLAAVFIIAEDLVRFLDDGVALETSMKDFLTWGSERYREGNFKKVFEGIRTKVS